MLPGAYDLELYRGDTMRRIFTLWQDAARTVPVDLTDAVPTAQMRDRRDSGTVLALMGCNVGLPNTIEVGLTAADTAELPPKGYWDLQVQFSNGDVSTVVSGAVSVRPDVTRPT